MLYMAHVGDSTGYLFDDNGCEKLTDEHRGDNMLEVHRVQEAGGKILMNRLSGVLAVTRAFGDLQLKNQGLIVRPDIKRVPIRLHHRYIVIASDGLWDFVPIKKVQKIIKEEVEADDIAIRLLKVAIS